MLIIGSIIPNVSVNVAQSRNPNESRTHLLELML